MPEVVIVSVYYRLDSIGFLAHPAFATNPELGDLNAGFLDQTEALRWVQNNIAAFGGDPAQVTIDGQSAGASSVELHLVAPQNAGLFNKAIAQSVYRTPLPTPGQQEVALPITAADVVTHWSYQPLFDFYAEKAGCGSGSLALQMACLRNANISALAPAQDATLYVLTR